MMSLLHALDALLAPLVGRAGFELSERASPPDAPTADVSRLEYRTLDDDGRVLLDFCLVVAGGTISVALWSPDDLQRASRGASLDAIARRYRVWRLDDAPDEGTLADEVAGVVAAWLEAGPARSMPA